MVVSAVQRPTAEHDDLPVGTALAADACLLELAGRFDAMVLRRLGKRLFEVVCPDAAGAVSQNPDGTVHSHRGREPGW